MNFKIPRNAKLIRKEKISWGNHIKFVHKISKENKEIKSWYYNGRLYGRCFLDNFGNGWLILIDEKGYVYLSMFKEHSNVCISRVPVGFMSEKERAML